MAMSRQEIRGMLVATTREKEGVEKRLHGLNEQLAEASAEDKKGIAWLETEIGLAERQLKGSQKELEKYQALAGQKPTATRAGK